MLARLPLNASHSMFECSFSCSNGGKFTKLQGFDCICKHGAFENQVQFIWLKTPHLIFETRSEESTVTPSFVAVPVARLACIVLGVGFFTAGERSQEKDNPKSTAESF